MSTSSVSFLVTTSQIVVYLGTEDVVDSYACCKMHVDVEFITRWFCLLVANDFV